MRTVFLNFYDRHGLEVRYAIIGGVNTTVGIGLFPFLYWLLPNLHSHYLILMILSQFICILFSYVTNKLFVFRSKSKNILEYLRFTLFYNIVFAFNVVLLPIAVKHFGFNPGKLQLAINCCIAVSSYFWHKYITFKHKS